MKNNIIDLGFLHWNFEGLIKNNNKIIAKKGSLHNPNNKHKIEYFIICVFRIEFSDELHK